MTNSFYEKLLPIPLLLSAFFIFSNFCAVAQISLTTGTYSQNFDSLASTGTGLTFMPSAWSFWETGSGANTTYSVSTGTSTAGDTYSFGAASATDRSLGSLASANVQSRYGTYFQNNTGNLINSITLAYTMEQWRCGGNTLTDSTIFSYAISSTNVSITDPSLTFTPYSPLTLKSVNNGAAAATLNGNLSTNQLAYNQTINLSLSNGYYLYIKWVDTNISGIDHCMGIDDLSLSFTTSSVVACTTPSTPIGLTITNNSSTPYSAQDGSFTTNGASSYMVLRSTSSSLSASPVDGTTYTQGGSLGGSTIAYLGSNGTFSSTGLAAATSYYYWIYALNTGCTGEPFYSAVSTSVMKTTGTQNGTLAESCVSNTTYTLTYAPPASASDGVVILAKLASSPTAPPIDFNSISGVSLDFTQAIGLSNGAKVVYAGNNAGAANFTITNLTLYDSLVVKAFSYTGATSTLYSTGTQESQKIKQPVVINASTTTQNAALGIQWTMPTTLNTCINEIMVVATNTSFTSLSPSGNGGTYTANAIYGNGTAFDGGFVVYKGSGTSTTISGLTNGTTYTFKIFTRTDTDWSEAVIVTGTPSSITPTIFNIGDLYLVGISSAQNSLISPGGCGTGSDDRIDLVSFVDINPGTVLTITDNGWERLNTNSFGSTEGTYNFTYNGTTPITAGTKFTWYLGTLSNITSINTSNGWTVSNTLPTLTGNFSLANHADQIYITQGGTWNLVSTNKLENSGLTVLIAATISGSWGASMANTTDVSALHPQAKCNNLVLNGDFLNYTGLVSDTTSSIWNTRLLSASNWTVNTACTSYVSALPTTVFATLPGAATTDIAWNGTTSTDWFTCTNWSPQRVPTMNDNVSIGTISGGNYPIIDNTLPSAIAFGLMANCKNLEVATLLNVKGDSNVLNIYGNLTISGGATTMLSMQDATTTTDGTINIYGNWNNTAGEPSFDEGESMVIFKGNNSQSIFTAASMTANKETFYKMVVNKTGGDITLSNNIIITSNLELLNKNIIAGTNIVEFMDNSTTSSASAYSLIIGKVSKTGNDAFLFPIGTTTNFKAVEISAPSLSTDIFTAQYMKTTPGFVNNIDPSFDHISQLEYWDINRTAGTSTVDVALYWNTLSQVNSTLDLKLAHYNGTIWQNINGVKDVANSKVIASAVNSFSPFTFGTNSLIQPLELVKCDFAVAKSSANSATVSWKLSKPCRTIIQRSKDGISFDNITSETNTVEGRMIDNNLMNGTNFYRLKYFSEELQSWHYSMVKSIGITTSNKIEIYPNPSENGKLTIVNLHTGELISIHDILGHLLHKKTSENTVIDINTSNWKAGLYTILVNGESYKWI